jgi:hypothetical protein
VGQFGESDVARRAAAGVVDNNFEAARESKTTRRH